MVTQTENPGEEVFLSDLFAPADRSVREWLSCDYSLQRDILHFFSS
jgi:hypothetical protein